MRIAFGVEYDGSRYCGWQKQQHLITVQETLEVAISRVANQPILITAAGRTDAGVHAFAQVIHFDTTIVRAEYAWVFGTNNYLPTDIRVHWAKVVAENFHARFSATARSYRYLIYNHRTPAALLHNRTFWVHTPLDEKNMQLAANYLIGEHDFSAFRGSGCQSKSSKRNVISLQVSRQDNLVIIDITANAFLLHMVRNIVGVLIAVGKQEQPAVWVKTVLESHDRRMAAVTAPPQGLYLVQVGY